MGESKHMTSQQETVDTIVKSLGAFVALGFAWGVLNALSGVVNPFGLFSGLAAISFFLTVATLCYVIFSSGALYLELN